MANNTINTRIKLKYDTLANWTSKDPVLLKGELAVVAIPTDATAMQVEGTTPPQILFKVGDGTSKFSQLQYASSKAADVYAWAKAASKPSYTSAEIKNSDGSTVQAVVTSTASHINNKSNPHAVTAAQVGAYTKDEVDSKFGALVDNDTTYTFAKTTKGFTITPKGGTAQTISFEYLTQAEVEALTVAKAKGISRNSANGSGSVYLPAVDSNGNFVAAASGWTSIGKGIEVTTSGQNGAMNTLKANISGNAATATKATQDGSGNNIVNTYATKEELEESISEIDFPVDSVNGQTGAVVLTGNDIKVSNQDGVPTISAQLSNLGTSIGDLQTNKVNKTTTVNGKALSGNISLDSTNIGYGGDTVVNKFGGKNVHECLDMLVSEDSSLAKRITNVETVVNGTDADTMDSVAELIDYVKEHGTEVTGMKADIKANADAIDVIEAKPAMGITSINISDWKTSAELTQKGVVTSVEQYDDGSKHEHGIKITIDNGEEDSSTVIKLDNIKLNTGEYVSKPLSAFISDVASARHTHSNKTVLDATTASYTTALNTKLSGIEAGAQVNDIESIRINLAGDATVDATIASGKQANITLPVANSTDAGLMSATDYAKLGGIASGAQVNVIESVSVNGVAAKISNKAASVTIDGTKVGYGSNVISAASGKDITTAINTVYSSVNSLSSKKFVEYDNTRANYYIIDCGDASN